MSGPRYAVIDVGTNTVRLLVAEQVEGHLVPAHTDKELLRLGRDVGVYEREQTNQQEIVQAITAGAPAQAA